MHSSDPVSSDPSYSVPPFPSFPSATRYVPLGCLEEALSRVCRSVDAREAISLVIGPPGTGKSLMSGLLEDRYRATHQVVTLGETPLRDRDAFLRRVLRQLGVDLNAIHSDDLQLAVLDRVRDTESDCDGILLVIDEAQSLSTEVLEAIRTVTNIMHRGEPRVFAVLCGGVKLDETLVQTSMEAFRQRVSTRCYLHPMNGEETKRYVSETIRACGAEPDETITAEAIAAVHHACSGVPRLLNQLLTQAIDCAEEADQSLIDERVIDIAWAQLQQLPSPMVEEPKIQIESTAVEFGELDESISEPINEPACATTATCDSIVVATEEEPSLHVHEFPASVDEHVQEFEEPTSFDDIVVEHGSAQWLADATTTDMNELENLNSPSEPEPPAEPKPAAKSSAALFGDFGDFDEEEDISVGESYQRPVAATDSPSGIEDILQQEIVGISPFPIDETASETFTCGDHEDDASGSYEREVEEILSLPQNDTRAQMSQAINTGSLEESAALNTTDSASTPSPLRIVNDDANANTANVEPRETISDSRDDADILVIEEEVEVRRIDRPEATVEPQPVLSIDYQQMLSRMRSGT